MLNVDLNRTPTLDAGSLSSDQLSGIVKGFPSCSLLGVAATNEGSGLHAAAVEYYIKAKLISVANSSIKTHLTKLLYQIKLPCTISETNHTSVHAWRFA